MPLRSRDNPHHFMKTRLVNYRDGEINLAFPIRGPKVTIGRENDNIIQLPHEKVSKYHALLTQEGERWKIQDLKSTNGVLVNGKKVTQSELKDQDLVKIGPYELYFETNVPADDWVPSHIIDVSSKVRERTMYEKRSGS
jgi:pSer/pThr/pTyr-binding forkhead associated (FHA) protein